MKIQKLYQKIKNKLELGFKKFLYCNGYLFNEIISDEKIESFLLMIRPLRSNFELVRLGGDKDGGYLLPNDFYGIKNCFSPGVSIVSGFEDDLAKMNIKSYMADYSVNRPIIENEKFDFIKKYIGFEINEHFISLENWIKEKENSDSEMILQMDIEGGEYDVLINTPTEILLKFRIIIIEFHDFHSLLDSYTFSFFQSCFLKLLKDFYVVHIHPNNNGELYRYKHFEIPSLLEFTLIRKDRVTSFDFETNFPNQLDKRNVLYKPEMILPNCFYK